MRESINYYRCELNGYLPLSRAESISLGKKLATGDKDAREQLIKSALKLVYRIAQDYQHMLSPASTISLNDLIQEGNLGLIHAVDSYDYRKNVKFSHYAHAWILSGIKACLRKRLPAVHLPNQIITQGVRLRKVYQELTAELGDRPSLNQLADAYGMDSKQVACIIQLTSQNTVLLSSKPYRQHETLSYADILSDESWLAGFEIFNEPSKLANYLSCLNKKELDILSNYLGLDGPAINFTDQSTYYGVSPERIRRIFLKSLAKIKQRIIKLNQPAKH